MCAPFLVFISECNLPTVLLLPPFHQDAQRELDKIAKVEAERIKKEEEAKREKQKLSTKGATGKCQGCGLKKCKKTCLFFKG